jgi:hypothetical protein
MDIQLEQVVIASIIIANVHMASAKPGNVVMGFIWLIFAVSLWFFGG